MNKEFFINSRKKYIKEIENESLSIFFSGKNCQRSADQEYDFEVDKNFYYLAGVNQANVILAIIKKDNTVKEVLFIEKNDETLTKWVGLKLETKEAEEISGITDIRFVDDFKDFVFASFNNSRKSSDSLKTLYLNLERRNEPNFLNLALIFSKDFKKNYPDITIKNSYNTVIALRMIKSEEEVILIKESVKTTRYAIEKLMKNSEVGLYEYQLETIFDAYIKYHGQKDQAFKTIAATGKNATILHYVNNNTVLQENDLILFDLGCRTKFYASDISRTIPVNGKFTLRQKEIYQEVLNVNKLCIDYLRPGVLWDDFNKLARTLLTESCERLGLLKEGKTITDFYYHNVGHFLGLDTHDPGLYDKVIQEGMVITVEPGIYIEDESIGIRIEDDILVTKGGNINLSEDIIKEIDDIEKFMAK